MQRPGFREIADDFEVGIVFQEAIENGASHLRCGAVGLLDGVQIRRLTEESKRHLVFFVCRQTRGVPKRKAEQKYQRGRQTINEPAGDSHR